MADYRDDFIIAIRYALLKKGAKQKFSLFFLIILSISIITLDKFSPPIMNTARVILNDFVYHVSVVSSQPLKFKKYMSNKIKLHYNVIEENKFLKKEMEFLKKQRFNNAFLASENELLKKAIDFAHSLKLDVHAGHGLTFESAKVLKRFKGINEFNIGHFIIGESIFISLEKVIKKFKKIIK